MFRNAVSVIHISRGAEEHVDRPVRFGDGLVRGEPMFVAPTQSNRATSGFPVVADAALHQLIDVAG